MRLVKLWMKTLEGEFVMDGSKHAGRLFSSNEMAFDMIATGQDETGFINSFFLGNSIFLFVNCGN
jgi:hypothetical protein